MKRRLGILAIAFAVLFSFCACKSSGSNSQRTDPAFLVEQHSTTEPTQDTATTASTASTAAAEATEPTTQPVVAKGPLPVGEGGRVFVFSSGVGAWRTELTLHADGSFAGQYWDSDMGDTGEGYPEGTAYVCDFMGAFQNITRVDEHTYKMTLWYLQTLELPGEEWIMDGVRYVASEPYGIQGGYDFILHLPDTPLEGLSEEFLSWWPYRFSEEAYDTLSCYGLENIAQGYGLFNEDE